MLDGDKRIRQLRGVDLWHLATKPHAGRRTGIRTDWRPFFISLGVRLAECFHLSKPVDDLSLRFRLSTLMAPLAGLGWGKLHYGRSHFLNVQGWVYKAQKSLHQGRLLASAGWSNISDARDQTLALAVLNFQTKIGTSEGEHVLGCDQYFQWTQTPGHIGL